MAGMMQECPPLLLCSHPIERELVAALEAVIHADRRVSLHEFAVLTLVFVRLLWRLLARLVRLVLGRRGGAQPA